MKNDDKPMRPQDIALVLENWAVVAEFFRSRNWPDTNLGHAAMFLHTELPKAMAELAAARSATVATLNMNDTVRVKLNQRGLDIMKANHDNLYDVVRKNGGAGREWSPPKLDSEGFYSTQLWCLMQEFGAHIRLGFDVPFETEIRLDKCAVTETAPQEKS